KSGTFFIQNTLGFVTLPGQPNKELYRAAILKKCIEWTDHPSKSNEFEYFYMAHEEGHEHVRANDEDEHTARYKHTHILFKLKYRIRCQAKYIACHFFCYRVAENGGIVLDGNESCGCESHPKCHHNHNHISKFGKLDSDWKRCLKYICKYDMDTRMLVLADWPFILDIDLKKMSTQMLVEKFIHNEAAMASLPPLQAKAVELVFDKVKDYLSTQNGGNDDKPTLLQDYPVGWQAYLITVYWNCKMHLCNSRNIMVIYDESESDSDVVGSTGKSSFVSSVKYYMGKRFKNKDGKYDVESISRGIPNRNNFEQIMIQKMEKGWNGNTLLINIARGEKMPDTMWSALESLKDGELLSDKYEGKWADNFRNVRIIVFMNDPPRVDHYVYGRTGTPVSVMQHLVPDRWRILQLVGGLNGELIPRDWRDFRVPPIDGSLKKPEREEQHKVDQIEYAIFQAQTQSSSRGSGIESASSDMKQRNIPSLIEFQRMRGYDMNSHLSYEIQMERHIEEYYRLYPLPTSMYEIKK